MKNASYKIALSSIACALATLSLVAGVYIPAFLAAGYVLAAFAVMIPLSKQYYGCAVLSAIGASLLAVFFGGGLIFKILPFAVFFGLHPTVNALQLKYRLNRWGMLAVKAVWFDITLLILWYFTFGGVSGYAWIDQYILPVVATAGSAVCFAYDYMAFRCQAVVYRLVHRFTK